MNLKNVLLTTKQTSLEYYKKEYDNPSDILDEEQLRDVTDDHTAHYKSFNYVKSVLDKRKIPYQRIYMPYGSYEDFVGRDLVISVGGDGTVLNTAHYMLDSTPLLTLVSANTSTGALCRTSTENFENMLERILNDDFEIQKWNRVEGRFGDKIDRGLNEILVGPRLRSGMSRYEISFNGYSEKQKSSGVVITTGAGSTAWHRNILNGDGVYDPRSPELKFVVTEPEFTGKYKIMQGIIKPGEIIRVKSLMNINGIISFDGDENKREYDFPRGKTIEIRLSDKPVYVIV